MKKDEVDVFSEWEKTERPYPWTTQHFVESITSPTSKCWVLEWEGNLASFVIVQVVAPEAYILNIMVKPDFRGKGFAQQMLEFVFGELSSSVSKVFLDVEINNTPAISLYQKLGFDVCEKRDGSYPRGESAFVMRKNLI